MTGAAFALVSELLGIPSLAFAVGIYLPLSTMTPVFVGGCLRALVERRAAGRGTESVSGSEKGVLLASGLIAGEGVLGIGIAVSAMIAGHKPEGFGMGFTGTTGDVVSLLAFGVLCWLLYRSTIVHEDSGASG